MQEDRIEKLFIKTILEQRPLAVKLFDTILNKDHFIDNSLGIIYKTCKEFYGKYKKFPTKEIILTEIVEQIDHKYINRNDDKAILAKQKETEEVEEIMKNINLMEYDTNQEKYYNEEMTEYLKEQEQKQSVLDIVDRIETKKNIFPMVERLNNTETLEISGGVDIQRIFTSTDFKAIEFGTVDYLLYPLIPEDSITLAVGNTGVGKTFFLMSLCDAITKGTEFGPWKATMGAQKILYVDGEMPFKYFQKNLNDIGTNDNFLMYCKSYDYNKKALQGTLWKYDIKSDMIRNG